MSNRDEQSDSSSESDNLSTTGLIATRAKRSTAGNLYATLRANLNDEDLQRDLLAEDDEEDAGDYEGSDRDGGDDDDEAMESSSDEEDAGPPKDGDAEDLSGEQALKKQERADLRRKRKAHEARLKLPAWRRKQEKRVKLADDVKTEDGSTVERPRKRSDRPNWLPRLGQDGPTRQSARSLAVANRETVHANLKQSAERSEKQRRVMKHAAAREHSKRRMDGMTQEERLKKCERIERETAKELGNWEIKEEERQRAREEMLAAKRQRGLDGPFIRYWSGSVLWVGDKIKIRRLSHGSQRVDDIKLPKEAEDHKRSDAADSSLDFILPSMIAHTAFEPHQMKARSPAPAEAQNQIPSQLPKVGFDQPVSNLATPQLAPQTYTSTIQMQQFRQELHKPMCEYTPSAPGLHALKPPQRAPLKEPARPAPPPRALPPQVYSGWPPGSLSFSIQPKTPPLVTAASPAQAPVPPVPLIREQAQRCLIILERFPKLETSVSTNMRRNKTAKDTSLLETDPIKSLILPESYPILTPEAAKYLLAKHKKKANELYLVPPPTKLKCALTSWPARFRHPRTGLPYADIHQYKAIQRILAGGCQWSVLLGCWVGPAYGAMGRPARGVPDAFAGIERPAPLVTATPAASRNVGANGDAVAKPAGSDQVVKAEKVD